MSAVSSPISPSRPGTLALWHAAAIVLATMPLVMAIAHRSAPLVIVLATVPALAAAAVERRAAALRRDLVAVLSTPLGITCIAFLLFAALSIAWSPDPKTSLQGFVEFIVPISGVLALALTLPGRTPRFLFTVLAAAGIAACVLMLYELWSVMALRRALGMRWNTFIYNRPALTLLVLAPPLIWGLAAEGRRRLAAAVAVVTAAAIVASDSGAATLGLLVGAAAYLVARWRRQAALAVAAAGIAAVALAPVAGELVQGAMPPAAHEKLRGSSSQARVDIWRSFGAAVPQQPWLGAGFSPGPSFPQSAGARRVDPAFATLLVVGHPHNGALQIWTELGAVGAFLALAVLGLVLRLLATLPDKIFAPSLALVAAAVSVSLVGHGLWQGWWAAAIGAAIVCFRIGPQDQKVGVP
jgi:exopolysaccharide production protein ExoQ